MKFTIISAVMLFYALYHGTEGQLDLPKCYSDAMSSVLKMQKIYGCDRDVPCCDKSLLCVQKDLGGGRKEYGKCVSPASLCVAGSSNPTSEANSCGEESKYYTAQKCCTLVGNINETPGVCVDGLCKCVADGESCTPSSDVCCNEGKDTMSCRDGKCQIATKEELMECMTGRVVTDSFQEDTCKAKSISPKERCCAPGDNMDKSVGKCSSNGLCLCVGDGELCGDFVCCNEGKNDVSCRSAGNKKKCLKGSDEVKCKTQGQLCSGVFGACCEPELVCDVQATRFGDTKCIPRG